MISANFTLKRTSKVGAGADGVRVNIFSGQWGGDNIKLTVTDDADCMPLTYMAYGEHGQGMLCPIRLTIL